ncbi:MAG: restriction endonuclease [Verrucomicrobiia bacterium]
MEPVRELFGVMAAEKTDRAVFITSGIYTQDAIQFAEGLPIDLVDGAQLAEMLRRFQNSLQRQSGTDGCGVPKGEPMSGRSFGGCSTYPKCRGVREVE